jgi:hypothetical protein
VIPDQGLGIGVFANPGPRRPVRKQLDVRTHTPMGEREPLAELTRRLLWCRAVERHRCRRSAGEARELRSPLPGPDVGNLDPVFPAVDDFVETMHVHDRRRRNETDLRSGSSVASPGRQSSERTIEGASTMCSATDLSGDSYEKKLACRVFHKRCTFLPHVFHTGRFVRASDTLDGRERGN